MTLNCVTARAYTNCCRMLVMEYINLDSLHKQRGIQTNASVECGRLTLEKQYEDADKRSAINSYTLSGYLSTRESKAIKLETANVSTKWTSTRTVMKNIAALGTGFMFVYSAFVSAQTLQSSIYSDHGIGVVSLSCIYTTTVISCFLAPKVIRKYSTKRTIVGGFVLFSLYFLCYLPQSPYALIPGSVILGLAMGPLWSAAATYITTLAIKYAKSSQLNPDYLLSKFMAMFYAFYQTTQVWGHLISVVALGSVNETNSVDVDTAVQSMRILVTNENVSALACGAWSNQLQLDDSVQYKHASTSTIYLRVGVYIACGVVSIIITAVCMVDYSSNDVIDCAGVSPASSCEMWISTLDMLRDRRCQRLIPLVIYIGLEQGFIFGDFTQWYIGCSLGVSKIGLICICFGSVSALSCLSLAYITKHLHRVPIVCAGAVFSAGLLLVLRIWKPRPVDQVNFYVLAACLGLCDAIWQTQAYALFGKLFMDRQEAAFATYRMFHATGCALAFGYSYFLCVATKIYILCAVLVCSLLGYGITEVKLHSETHHMSDIVAL